MGDTFYSILGVDTDAESDDIQEAYREHVKESHPDVSDDPDASSTFKRVTTARDVLVDDAERRRYDRLGHEQYVDLHVQESAWTETVNVTVTDKTDVDTGTTQSQTWWQEHRGTDATGGTRSSQDSNGQAHSTNSGVSGSAGTGAGTQRQRADGGHGTESWQEASATYRRSAVDVDTGPDSVVDAVVIGAREVGGWMVVHFTLILSAILTTWFMIQATAGANLPVSMLLAGVLFLPLVIALSVLHIMLTLYS